MICRLNVARLANVPESVLEIASVKSKQLEHEAGGKALHYLYVFVCWIILDTSDHSRSRLVRTLLENADSHQLDQLIAGIEQL